MKATHVRCLVRGKFGTIIGRGDWYPATPENIKMLKEANRITASVESSGRTYHLAYSHPASVKQRKALEHGYRIRSIKGAARLMRNVQTKYAKELNLAAPNSNYRLQLVVSLLEEIVRDLQRKGPL